MTCTHSSTHSTATHSRKVSKSRMGVASVCLEEGDGGGEEENKRKKLSSWKLETVSQRISRMACLATAIIPLHLPLHELSLSSL